MTYSRNNVSQMIDDIAEVCNDNQEWVFRLVWEGKGNTPTYPWPDMALNLEFEDETLETFGIIPFDKQLPETASKVSISSKGLYRTITRANLEIVLGDFIDTFGNNPIICLGC